MARPLLAVALSMTTALSAWALPSPAIKRAIEKDLKAHRGTQFEPLIDTWSARYGANAGPALYELASKPKTPDAHKYIAILSAARLGAAPKTAQIESFLQDKSWMVRVAMLRALPLYPHQLEAPGLERALKTGLKDKALVVRLEAVEAARRLKPPGMFEWLHESLTDPVNFHRGKSQWIPERVLEIYAENADQRQAPKLKAVLATAQDPRLLEKAIRTLETMTGQMTDRKLPLQAQAKVWVSRL